MASQSTKRTFGGPQWDEYKAALGTWDMFLHGLTQNFLVTIDIDVPFACEWLSPLVNQCPAIMKDQDRVRHTNQTQNVFRQDVRLRTQHVTLNLVGCIYASDPPEGIVFFGGDVFFQPRTTQFEPEDIVKHCSLNELNDRDTLIHGTQFFQREFLSRPQPVMNDEDMRNKLTSITRPIHAPSIQPSNNTVTERKDRFIGSLNWPLADTAVMSILTQQLRDILLPH